MVLGLDLDLVLDLFMLVDDDVDFEDDKVDGTDDDIKDMFMVFVFLSAIDFLIIFPLPQFFTQVSYISLSNELEIVRVLKMDKMVINEKRGVPTMIYCLFVLCGDFCSSIFNSFLIS